MASYNHHFYIALDRNKQTLISDGGGDEARARNHGRRMKGLDEVAALYMHVPCSGAPPPLLRLAAPIPASLRLSTSHNFNL